MRGGDSSGIEEFDTDEADRSLNEKSSAQKKYEQQRFRVQPGPIENYSLGRGSLAQKVLKGPRKRSQMFLKETLQNKKTNFILALCMRTSMCLILICNKSYFAIFYLKLFTQAHPSVSKLDVFFALFCKFIHGFHIMHPSPM